MLANREGVFHAYPVNIGIDEVGQNKLTTCIIEFALFEERGTDGEFADIAEEQLRIMGYFFLEKRDGTLNEFAIKTLQDALGWDGRDPFWLQDTDLSGHPVQITLEFEEYDGKDRLKVKWLNPFGSKGGGGIPRADDATRRSIMNRLGSKFRATAGGTPQNAPKPAGAPAAPPARKPAAPPTAAKSKPEEPAAESSLDAVWARFIQLLPPNMEQAQIEAEWFDMLGEVFPDRAVDNLNGADWAVVLNHVNSKFIPF